MALLFLAACGGSSGTDGKVPVIVTILDASSYLQAGATVQLQSMVTGSSNQAVTWSVASGIGSITQSGIYSAPANVDANTNAQVTATAAADPAKSASATITIFPAPAIGVRQSSGRGEFFITLDGAVFVPRGNSYLHFNPNMTSISGGDVGFGRSTLNATLYDANRTEQAFTTMESQGYNVVRTFLDILDIGDIGNDSGPGLSQQYLANLSDFMTRAKAHHIYVLPIFEALPFASPYRDYITGDLETNFGEINIQTLTQPGVAATQKFWQDFVNGLLAAHAPMDALFGYELMGEFYIDNSSPPMDKTSGIVQTADGQAYDMSNATARVSLQNNNMVFYANTMRDAIHSINPSAIVDMGFFTYNGTNPPPFPAIATSEVDFIDLHGWPDGSGTTIDQLVASWQVNGDLRKPIIMGEYDGFQDVFPTTTQAADGLKAWQIASCSDGFSGWILWTWDTAPGELPGLNIWAALSGNGEIDNALAPAARQNPCSN